MSPPGYIGKAEYCYANSAAMLLAATGATVSPEAIEVCCGIGLSGFIGPGGRLFFSPSVIAPDSGLSRAFDLLGFQVDHGSFDPDEALAGLGKLLNRGPVLIGPVDMGQLSYNPNRSAGADHFVLVYGQDGGGFRLHDPYGFPNVRLAGDDLLVAWRAEAVDYKQSACQFWQSPRRIQDLTKDQVAGRVWQFFREIYQQISQGRAGNRTVIGAEAINQTARALAAGNLSKPAIGFLTGFSLPLAAKRAGDYAAYLASARPEFARLKLELADQFGVSQSQLASGNIRAAAASLKLIANLEAEVDKLVGSSLR